MCVWVAIIWLWQLSSANQNSPQRHSSIMAAVERMPKSWGRNRGFKPVFPRTIHTIEPLLCGAQVYLLLLDLPSSNNWSTYSQMETP